MERNLFRYFLRIFGIGWVGVDLFFVLSGFLIGGILLDAKSSDKYFKTFYLRRIHRIFPLYYASLTLYILILVCGLYLGASRLESSSVDLVRVPRYLLYIQNWSASGSPFEYFWLGPTWSLAVEEQFYLVAPVLIRFLSVRSLTTVLVGTVLVAPLLRLLTFLFAPHGSIFAVNSTPCRADDLAMGMLGAVAVRSEWFWTFQERHPRFISRACFTLGLGMLGWLWWLLHPMIPSTVSFGLSWVGLFCLSLILTALTHPAGFVGRFARWRFLRRAGTLSYCIYIIHFPLNLLLHKMVEKFDVWNGLLLSLAAAGLTWGIASLSWRYFEKPLVQRGHSYSY